MATLEQVRELMGKMHEERGQLFAALKDMPEERAIQANPELDGEDGWSVKEILVHVGQMEITYRGWVHRALTEDRPDLGVRPSSAPAPETPHYLTGANDRSMLELLRNLETIRSETMALYATIPLEDFERTAKLDLFGELTAMQWMRSHYRHDRQHWAQILGRESEYAPRYLNGGEPDQRRS